MSERAQRVIDYCRALAQCSEERGRTTRTFLSPPMREVHQVLGDWMGRIGMAVSVDAAGNLRGLLAGDGPRTMIASHLDTVPDSGAFDGVLGVVLGIALAEIAARCEGRPAIEVVGFSEEEGVRYGVPFIGSRAVAGTLTDDLVAMASDAIRGFGLDPSLMDEARFDPATGAYLEFHIEQGPVLESLGLTLGVVDAIAGQTRADFTFEGQANHAGTSPMSMRKDALAGASEWILAVEKIAATYEGLVATCGRIHSTPNATNVVPGKVDVSLDVRHASDAIRGDALSEIQQAAWDIARWRRLGLMHQIRMEQPAVPMDSTVRERLAQAVEAAGFAVHHMTSGAGHDAMVMAPHIPSAMLFLRSPGGISHSPLESVLKEDVEAALAVGEKFLCLS